MKRFGWILLLLAASAPAWAATSVTVDQVKQKLISLQQNLKGDVDVAAWLSQVELSEQLTRNDRSALEQVAPGPLAGEQFDILEGHSAFLAPPAASLPATPAPDAAAQKALLAKAADFVAKTSAQNPHLTASKITTRFQDILKNSSSSVGLTVNALNPYTREWDARDEQVESEKGIEKSSSARAKTKWGENGQISDAEPPPSPSAILGEVAAASKLSWLRWETIDSKPAAVLSFAVDKKKSHYLVSYCCFPNTDTQSGIAASGTFVPIPGEIQSITTWKPFKKVVSYHGELFIEPQTGALVRLNLYAELKPTDFVHQEARRIDYRPVVVAGKEYELPVDSYILNEVVPGGDSNTSAYSARHSLFNVTYQNYQLAGTAAASK
jgi:hypothetical protein